MNRYTYIDLFCGIGGMHLGFRRAGFQCVFACDSDRFCRQAYGENFEPKPKGDIRQIKIDEIPEHDVLVAGFPCQPFSMAGVTKRNSFGRPSGFDDPGKGDLFFEVIRVLKAKTPKAFLLENVKNLKFHNKGETFKQILRTLESVGYQTFAEVLNAKRYVPQNRERLFIVGIRKDLLTDWLPYWWNLDYHKPPALKDILQPNVDPKYTISDRLLKCLKEHEARAIEKGNGFRIGYSDLNKPTRTLTAHYYKDGSEILIEQPGKNPRKLTPRECARLMGFPDSFKIVVSDSQAYKQFGNSVVVPLIARIADRLKNFLDMDLGCF